MKRLLLSLTAACISFSLATQYAYGAVTSAPIDFQHGVDDSTPKTPPTIVYEYEMVAEPNRASSLGMVKSLDRIERRDVPGWHTFVASLRSRILADYPSDAVDAVTIRAFPLAPTRHGQGVRQKDAENKVIAVDMTFNSSDIERDAEVLLLRAKRGVLISRVPEGYTADDVRGVLAFQRLRNPSLRDEPATLARIKADLDSTIPYLCAPEFTSYELYQEGGRVNASAYPFGIIVVTDGFIDFYKATPDLAMETLAHEVGHSHRADARNRQYQDRVVADLESELRNELKDPIVRARFEAYLELVLMRMNRLLEQQADITSAMIFHARGRSLDEYLRSASAFNDRALEAASPRRRLLHDSDRENWLGTHPYNRARMEGVVEWFKAHPFRLKDGKVCSSAPPFLLREGEPVPSVSAGVELHVRSAE